MNNRDYKEFAPGEIFHIYNRGVSKMKIFIDEKDYEVFLHRLIENLYPESIDRSALPKRANRRKILPPNSYDLISYCLMPNHFHLLIKQNANISISKIILKIMTGYCKYFNKKYGRVGQVFQDRFKAVRVDSNSQLLWLSYYIHNNPVEAGFVSDPKDCKWNSFSEYLGESAGSICKKDLILAQFQNLGGYLDYFDNQKLEENRMIGSLSCFDLLLDHN
jgi:putative transposase